MDSHDTVAHARISCQRCHRRKKKCDRTLPQCDKCRSASVNCSFLEDEQQTGSYSIAFVDGLQKKIRQLEEQVADLSATTPRAPQSLHSAHNPPLADMATEDFVFNNQEASWLDSLRLESSSWASAPPVATPASFVNELKLLSLAATAERHLGDASGLSFARLTQMVLSRLSPDKAEFVFEDYVDPTLPQPLFPSGEALGSMYPNIDASLTNRPTMFSGFSMSVLADSSDLLEQLTLSKVPHLHGLTNFYFAHSHTLYPIIDRASFLNMLQTIQTDPTAADSQSPLWLFRIWMVLAIGSTAYCSVTLDEESGPVSYYNKAMVYFEAALNHGDIAALEVLLLQVSYSLFNQLGPNTWFLVGVAARIAIGIGLHSASFYEGLSIEVSEHRKRLFFSVYMMDRVVSNALGRPFAIHDDDVDAEPFRDMGDDDPTANGIETVHRLEPTILSIPLHILALRQLAGRIVRQVYSAHARCTPVEQRDSVIRSLHKDLIEWRRGMPFPLPDIHPRVPQLSSNWFDFNFYTHLALLYRPSPLSPTLDETRVKILADAAAKAIRQAVIMHQQGRFAFNWLNFLSLYTMTLSLVYATTASPDTLLMTLKQSKAVTDLECAMELFETMGVKFPVAKKIKRMVEQIISRYKEILSTHA